MRSNLRAPAHRDVVEGAPALQPGGGPPRGMMLSLGGNPGMMEIQGTMRRLLTAISAVLLLAGLLLGGSGIQHLTVTRVVWAVVLVLGGLVAFGLTLREE